MRMINSDTVVVPAGTYVLGDPCYAIPEQYWDRVLDVTDCFSNPTGALTVNGNTYHVLGFGTTYGDGCYPGSDNLTYPVDAGLIGLVPYELAIAEGDDVPQDGLHRIVEFANDTICHNHDGVMRFGDITINTNY